MTGEVVECFAIFLPAFCRENPFNRPYFQSLRSGAESGIVISEVLVGRILEAVVQAVPVPVTLKFRTGWDKESRNALTITHIAEQSGIRLLSLVCILGIWEIFGGMIDPVLFTVPSKIAVAAVGMIASGELWNYLWPSLVVLAVGLTLAAIIGIAIGLLLARFRLSKSTVCLMSQGRAPHEDFHDYPDSADKFPDHFAVMTCERCGKKFTI